MRKPERQINDPKQIEAILNRADILRLGMCGDDGWPYVVPMNFGYSEGAIYMHGAMKGKRFDILAQNNKVCFEVDLDVEILPAAEPCKWGVRYQSIIGYAKMELAQGDDKIAGLNAIMRKYSGQDWEYGQKVLDVTAVFKLNIESMTGKRRMPDLEN